MESSFKILSNFLQHFILQLSVLSENKIMNITLNWGAEESYLNKT